MKCSVCAGRVCSKCPAKHPAKGGKTLPFLSSPGFQKAQKMNCKKCCLKKIFDSCSINPWKIKSIFFNTTRSLTLEFELWPLAGLCSVLARSSRTRPQMASMRISHSSYSSLFIFFLLLLLVTLYSPSEQANKAMVLRVQRWGRKIKERKRTTSFCLLFQNSLSVLISLKRILGPELKNGSYRLCSYFTV